jgi:hypothetical protein
MEVVMRRIWPVVYFLGAISAVYTGYCELLPETTAKTNADWIFVSVSFVISTAAPSLSIAFARSRGVERFRRPSLTRQPFAWWSDTLQPIRLVVIGLLCSVVGAAFALKETDAQGVMLFYWFLGMAMGWLIGERIVYAWLRDRVIGSCERGPFTPPLEPFTFYLAGLVFLIIGYVSTTTDQLFVWLNERQQIFLRAEHPAIFACLTGAMFAIAAALCAVGFLLGRGRSAG